MVEVTGDSLFFKVARNNEYDREQDTLDTPSVDVEQPVFGPFLQRLKDLRHRSMPDDPLEVNKLLLPRLVAIFWDLKGRVSVTQHQ